MISLIVDRLPANEVDPQNLRSLLVRVVPPQIEAHFITREVTGEDDDAPHQLLDMGLLSHDGVFVGCTIYRDRIMSETVPCRRIVSIMKEIGQKYLDLGIGYEGGIGEEWHLRAIKSEWDLLLTFADALERAIKG